MSEYKQITSPTSFSKKPGTTSGGVSLEARDKQVSPTSFKRAPGKTTGGANLHTATNKHESARSFKK